MKHNDQLPDGLLAQMIEHYCTGIHRGHGFKSCTGLVFTTAQVVFITQKITFIFTFVDRVCVTNTHAVFIFRIEDRRLASDKTARTIQIRGGILKYILQTSQRGMLL